MQLFFYANSGNGQKNRLETAIHGVVPGACVEFFGTLDEFRERLHCLIEPNSIAVLLASDREELIRMQMFRKLLPEIFVILVLPDQSENTIALAHALMPRYLVQKDDPFTDLQGVLTKMALSTR
jgi:hypothetical protein